MWQKSEHSKTKWLYLSKGRPHRGTQ
jgi:hypothetical protein